MTNRGGSRTRLLLVSLLVISLFFITLDLRGIGVTQQARTVTSSVLSPFQRVISDAFSPIGNFFSNVKNFGRIKAQVTTLKETNSSLKTQILKEKDLLGQYKDLQKNFDLAGAGGFKIKPARVIGRGSSSSFSQTITIDVGQADGVRTNMTVINGDGIVGVVKSISSTTSIVELMSDPNFKMGVRIAGSGSAGVLTGNGTNNFDFQLLDPTGNISEGDQLLTLGSDNNRPYVPGIPVGYITKVTTTSGDLTQQGVVSSYANLNNLGIVSVVLKGANHDLRDSLIPPKPVNPVTPVTPPASSGTSQSGTTPSTGGNSSNSSSTSGANSTTGGATTNPSVGANTTGTNSTTGTSTSTGTTTSNGTNTTNTTSQTKKVKKKVKK